jgi:hypothetical protein
VTKVKVILGGAILALLVSTGWQFAACELAYYELQDDLKDLSSLNRARIGMAPPSSDDDLRDAVIDKARSYDIALDPQRVIVRRSGSTDAPVVYLAADYRARIHLPGYTFVMHFHPTSGNRR